MRVRTLLIGCLVLCSGACSLTYQVAWLREMRLIFGASTLASATVLALFMGGLGLGGAILGKRADRSANPLRLYANLEFGIALAAFVSPYLLDVLRLAYIHFGGEAVLGSTLATLVRLLLAACVIVLPTFLMGGTLSAVARAAETRDDAGRRILAFLYGINTLGAVVGAAASTFLMLELFGTRDTILVAVLLNVLLAICARSLARTGSAERAGQPVAPTPSLPAHPTSGPAAPPVLVYCAAAIVGFTFFCMELVWYRMLGPILGGTTYSFGLILTLALAGIGLGGAAYSLRGQSRPATARGFAVTCGLEALFLALPFALGDYLALLAGLIAPLGNWGLSGSVLGWTLVTGVVVFPAALVAGYQFPLLIALLGQGAAQVGRHTGLTYAWNTVGAILGALLGGFVLLPILTAPGCWKFAVVLLALLGAAFLVRAQAPGSGLRNAYAPGVPLVLACLLLLATGPTDFWRHSGIGAGRLRLASLEHNAIVNAMRQYRRHVTWETEGRETSVAINEGNGLAFVINGKTDGNVKSDAITQVLLGLVSATLHPHPKTSLVVGLGTGCSAGWLAQVPGMERVDVAEFEPGVLEVARRCSAANFDVLDNPKVSIAIADAREMLLTSKASYDLIVSEPSNPYRAGIASLYTLEFYRAAAGLLHEDGYFSQWVQSYEVSTETINTIYATLQTVFPYVETWVANPGDLLLICSKKPLPKSASALRQRLALHPFDLAMAAITNATDLEGFLSHYIAGPALARHVADTVRKQKGDQLNTDDKMLVEFGFAKSLGKRAAFAVPDVGRLARSMNADRPELVDDDVDWQRRDASKVVNLGAQWNAVLFDGEQRTAMDARLKALNLHYSRDFKNALQLWKEQPAALVTPLELAARAEAYADAGDATALQYIAALPAQWSAVGASIKARLLLRQGDPDGTVASLEAFFATLRSDPWPNSSFIENALSLAQDIGKADKARAQRLFAALQAPFVVSLNNENRCNALLELSRTIDPAHTAQALGLFEPHTPWTRPFLSLRYLTYKETAPERAPRALRDLTDYFRYHAATFSEAVPDVAEGAVGK